ncbi:MAG: DUF934 domain-containing protein [Pseudomonadota bacterium]
MTETVTLWKDGRFFKDSFKLAEAGETSGDLIISADEWLSGDYANHNGRLGLSLQASDDIEALSKDFERFDVIVVNFPGFANGTAFSIARLVRDRHGYSGAIRASGAYILDQMPLLLRCGVDHFEISSDAVRTGLQRGSWPDLEIRYQHALDGDDTSELDAKRPWLTAVFEADDAFERKVA